MFKIGADSSRAKRLTTGSSVFTGSQTRLNLNADSGSADVLGIFYTPGESSEVCKTAGDGTITYYNTDFFI